MTLQTRNYFLLLITATIWGSGFVAQALGMEHVSPFTFTWARSIIGGLFLLAVIPLLDAWTAKQNQNARAPAAAAEPQKPAASPWKNPRLWPGGFCCGTALFIAESLQQFGLLYTTVGKAGFLTSLYVVLVPVIGIFIGRRTSLNVWAAVILAVAGLYFLCMKQGEFELSLGDSLVVACAFAFTIHILVIDRFAPLVECVRMSCLQFFVGSVWGFVFMFIFEPPTLEALRAALPAMLYAGILSNGIAYTLQVVAQNGVHPTIASIILSTESMASVFFGWLIMNESMNARELIGCALMMTAIVLAQLPASVFKRLFKN